jgi:hypothetical protein
MAGHATAHHGRNRDDNSLYNIMGECAIRANEIAQLRYRDASEAQAQAPPPAGVTGFSAPSGSRARRSRVYRSSAALPFEPLASPRIPAFQRLTHGADFV